MDGIHRPRAGTTVRMRNSPRDANCTTRWAEDRIHSNGSRTDRKTPGYLLNPPQRCQVWTMLHRLSGVESTYAAGPLVGISDATIAPRRLHRTRRFSYGTLAAWRRRRIPPSASASLGRMDGVSTVFSKHEAWYDSCLGQQGHVEHTCRHVRG